MISLEMKQMAVELVSEACINGATERNACEVLRLSCRTLRRWRERLRNEQELIDQRKKSAKYRTYPQALTDEEKVEVLKMVNSPEFRSLPPSQIVPILADRGRYIASESSIYRILRQAGQCQLRGRAHAPRKITPPKAFEATHPNQVWTWDITYLPTLIKGDFYRLYMVMDIYSRLIVGWEIHLEETAINAASLIEKACKNHSVRQSQLVLHSDNGSPMKGATMLAMLEKLGVATSFSRPSVSDDNPYSESLFRTLKYTPKYPRKPFGSIEEARDWVLKFVRWYNLVHRHSGIQFVTPAERHHLKDIAILEKRSKVYAQAKAMSPQRWNNRSVRNWTPEQSVWLNPPKKHREQSEMRAAA
jgi:transposase InsO family protein